jgi:hypothetical protein
MDGIWSNYGNVVGSTTIVKVPIKKLIQGETSITTKFSVFEFHIVYVPSLNVTYFCIFFFNITPFNDQA